MMMIKKDKEAADKEMTQGATAHLVSLPSSPLDTPCPPIVYKISSISTVQILSNSTVHQLTTPDRIQDIIHFYSAPTIHSGYIALPAVIV